MLRLASPSAAPRESRAKEKSIASEKYDNVAEHGYPFQKIRFSNCYDSGCLGLLAV
jgi:hypothetical protein